MSATLTRDSIVKAPFSITVSDSAVIQDPSEMVGVGFLVTAVGNIKVGWSNGFTLTFPVNATGYYQFPWAINQVFTTGTTATITAIGLR